MIGSISEKTQRTGESDVVLMIDVSQDCHDSKSCKSTVMIPYKQRQDHNENDDVDIRVNEVAVVPSEDVVKHNSVTQLSSFGGRVPFTENLIPHTTFQLCKSEINIRIMVSDCQAV